MKTDFLYKKSFIMSKYPPHESIAPLMINMDYKNIFRAPNFQHILNLYVDLYYIDYEFKRRGLIGRLSRVICKILAKLI